MKNGGQAASHFPQSIAIDELILEDDGFARLGEQPPQRHTVLHPADHDPLGELGRRIILRVSKDRYPKIKRTSDLGQHPGELT
jgi:hypothetical protein